MITDRIPLALRDVRTASTLWMELAAVAHTTDRCRRSRLQTTCSKPTARPISAIWWGPPLDSDAKTTRPTPMSRRRRAAALHRPIPVPVAAPRVHRNALPDVDDRNHPHRVRSLARP